MLEALRRFNAAASAFLIHAGAAGLVLMAAIIGWQVFGRYVMGASPSWAEQAALILMIWYVFFAAAAGVREGFHIRIVALQSAVPAKVAVILRVAAHLIVGGCGLALAIWGSELVARTWSHVIPTLFIPRGLAYLALPLSGALMTLFVLELLINDARREDRSDKEQGRWS